MGKGSRTFDFHHKNTDHFLAKMMPILRAMTKSAVVLLINDHKDSKSNDRVALRELYDFK